MPSKHFQDLLKRMDGVHVAKSHDYASEDGPFSNFERAAIIASWFNTPIDQVFATLIGVKIARLAELCNGKTPKNESIDDNGLDLANYAGLWQAFREYNRERESLINDRDEVNRSKVGPSGGQIFPDGPSLPYCDLCHQYIRNGSIMEHVLIMHKNK